MYSLFTRFTVIRYSWRHSFFLDVVDEAEYGIGIRLVETCLE
jgi:hypothetical protein